MPKIRRAMKLGGDRIGGDRKIRRGAQPGHIHVAACVQRDSEGRVFVVAAEISRVIQVRARRAHFGQKHIAQAAVECRIQGVVRGKIG